ncbi:MAG: hypothetical protein QF464_06025 [Myxococcota bacterium]|nr:hypothetical protein [Myxococcota bacterium]
MRARLDTVVEVREHTLRYNPAGCRCPAFEIALGPHWQRVRLAVDDTSDPTLVALLEASRHATDQTGRTYIVAGTLTDLVDRCGAGTAVVSLEPTAFMGAKIRETPRSPP